MSTDPRACALLADEPQLDCVPQLPDRVHALALDILHRIRPVCAHMPDEELLTLATSMAIVELRYFESATARRSIA